MNRSAKKIIYGVFYLAFLYFFAAFVYNVFLKPAPTCFDKIQNQGETGVDCGGPCASCPLSQAEPLKTLSVEFFGTTAGKTVVLADALNPNQNYGVQNAPYEILVYNKNGAVIETVNGEESFRPSEEKHIFNADLQTSFRNIAKADLIFTNPHWQPASDFSLRPNLVLGSVLKTALVGEGIQVTGTVVNQAPFTAADVEIAALIFNKFGNPIFASQTLVVNLIGGGEANFVVVFPADSNLNAAFDPAATQIFFSSQ